MHDRQGLVYPDQELTLCFPHFRGSERSSHFMPFPRVIRDGTLWFASYQWVADVYHRWHLWDVLYVVWLVLGKYPAAEIGILRWHCRQDCVYPICSVLPSPKLESDLPRALSPTPPMT